MDDAQWIRDQLESIQSQLRSLTATISNNTAAHSNKLTELEALFSAHRERDDLLHEAIDVRFEKDEKDLNLAFARIKEVAQQFREFEEAKHQVEGARKAWRVVVAIGGAILMGFELWAHFGAR